MISLKAPRLSGSFRKRLDSRMRKWRQVGSLAARIQVPRELRWWYFQEFGTGEQGESGVASGHSYPIRATNAPLLIFPWGGVVVQTVYVEHPGVPPRSSVRKVLSEIRSKAGDGLHKAFKNGAADSPRLLLNSLAATAQSAKGLIARSLHVNVPGTREAGEIDGVEYPAGKLKGRTAGDVFWEKAKVVTREGGGS